MAITAWASESLQELDLLLRERAYFRAANHDSPDGGSLAHQRSGQYRAMSSASLKAQTFRKLRFRLCRHIVNMGGSSVDHGATGHGSTADKKALFAAHPANWPIMRGPI